MIFNKKKRETSNRLYDRHENKEGKTAQITELFKPR